MGLQAADTEDSSLDLQIRIAEIDAKFKPCYKRSPPIILTALMRKKQGRLMNEKNRLQHQFDQIVWE